MKRLSLVVVRQERFWTGEKKGKGGVNTGNRNAAEKGAAEFGGERNDIFLNFSPQQVIPQPGLQLFHGFVHGFVVGGIN